MLIIFLAAPGRCFVCNNNMLQEQEKATKTAVLSSTNVLFGIFTGVINFCYICSCEIHETAKNRKVSQCHKSKTKKKKILAILRAKINNYQKNILKCAQFSATI